MVFKMFKICFFLGIGLAFKIFLSYTVCAGKFCSVLLPRNEGGVSPGDKCFLRFMRTFHSQVPKKEAEKYQALLRKKGQGKGVRIR